MKFSAVVILKREIFYIIKDGATTGVSIINTLNEPFSMLSSVALIKTSQEIDNEYLNYVMNSHYFYNISIGSMSGNRYSKNNIN
ncbi:Uncharacterised protein [Mannheimia haemolytica]|uniref:Uncharacterized protein n=1 Tax=Mannheimia haemolytica TaxID=75985 RepID=A0A378MTJ7_MANHA|nr:Uncharacterised protein [Mannheimia haemolytica]